MITIITPSVRKEGLNIIRQSLLKQTYKDWEWLIGSAFDPEIPEAKWIKDDFSGGFWTLNRIYNKLISNASSNLIVSWQDWIYIPPDGLQKFIDAADKYPGAVISGVGDQYEKIDKHGKPEIKIWSDPRKTDKYGSFYEIFPNDAEWNWCLIPKDALYNIGGMDEGLDSLGFGGDQLQVGERLNTIGTKFYIDQTNESYTIRHSRDDFGGQKNWDDNHVLFNGKYDARKDQLIHDGLWPKLDYLK
jgi:hypothetical protein